MAFELINRDEPLYDLGDVGIDPDEDIRIRFLRSLDADTRTAGGGKKPPTGSSQQSKPQIEKPAGDDPSAVKDLIRGMTAPITGPINYVRESFASASGSKSGTDVPRDQFGRTPVPDDVPTNMFGWPIKQDQQEQKKGPSREELVEMANAAQFDGEPVFKTSDSITNERLAEIAAAAGFDLTPQGATGGNQMAQQQQQQQQQQLPGVFGTILGGITTATQALSQLGGAVGGAKVSFDAAKEGKTVEQYLAEQAAEDAAERADRDALAEEQAAEDDLDDLFSGGETTNAGMIGGISTPYAIGAALAVMLIGGGVIWALNQD